MREVATTTLAHSEAGTSEVLNASTRRKKKSCYAKVAYSARKKERAGMMEKAIYKAVKIL